MPMLPESSAPEMSISPCVEAPPALAGTKTAASAAARIARVFMASPLPTSAVVKRMFPVDARRKHSVAHIDGALTGKLDHENGLGLFARASANFHNAEGSAAEVEHVADVPRGSCGASERRRVGRCPVRELELVGEGHSVSLPLTAGTERLGSAYSA